MVARAYKARDVEIDTRSISLDSRNPLAYDFLDFKYSLIAFSTWKGSLI